VAGWRVDLPLRELRNPDRAGVDIPAPGSTYCRASANGRPACCRSIAVLDFMQGRNAGSFERSIGVLVSKVEPNPQESTLIKTVRSGAI